ncbi:hypothetical protein HN510_03165 [Candidatus Woesearchaeota archaeon]|nr:hypothetical protein [Candidatus Woesearchaeota archaeon]
MKSKKKKWGNLSPKQIAAVKKNLIPHSKRSKAEVKRIAAIGGRHPKGPRNTTNMKIMNRLKKLKQEGLTDENAAWLHDMMTDSEMASMHILEYIHKLQKQSGEVKDVNAAVKTTMDWFKIKHGTKENDKKIKIAAIILTKEEKEKEIIRLMMVS